MKGNYPTILFPNSPKMNFNVPQKQNPHSRNNSKDFHNSNTRLTSPNMNYNPKPLQSSNITNFQFMSPQPKLGNQDRENQENLRKVVSNEKFFPNSYFPSKEILGNSSLNSKLNYQPKFASKDIIQDEKSRHRIIQNILEAKLEEPNINIEVTKYEPHAVNDPVPPKLLNQYKKPPTIVKEKLDTIQSVASKKTEEEEYHYNHSTLIAKPLICVSDIKSKYIENNKENPNHFIKETSKNSSMTDKDPSLCKNSAVRIWENYYDNSNLTYNDLSKSKGNFNNDDFAFSEIQRSHSNTIGEESLDITLMNIKKGDNQDGTFSFCDYDSQKNLIDVQSRLEKPFKDSYDNLYKSHKELKERLKETEKTLKEEQETKKFLQSNSTSELFSENENLKKEIKTLLKTREFETMAFNEKYYKSESERKKVDQDLKELKEENANKEKNVSNNIDTGLVNSVNSLFEKAKNSFMSINLNTENLRSISKSTNLGSLKSVTNLTQSTELISKWRIFYSESLDQISFYFKKQTDVINNLRYQINKESENRIQFASSVNNLIDKQRNKSTLLKNKVKALKMELFVTKNANSSLQKEFQSVNHQLKSTSNSESVINIEMTNLRNKLNVSERTSSNLIGELKSENIKLEKELQNKKNEINELTQKINTNFKGKYESDAVTLSRFSFLENKVSSLQIELTKCQESSKDMLATQLARNAESMKYTIEEEKKRLKSYYEIDLLKQRKGFESELNSKTNSYEQDIKLKTEEISSLQKEISSLQTEISAYNETIVISRNELKEEKEGFERKLLEIMENQEESKKDLSLTHSKEVTELKKLNKEVQTKLKEKNSEIESLKREYSISKGKHLAEHLTQQSNELSNLHQTIHNLQETITEKDEKISDSQYQLEIQTSKSNSIENRFKLLKEENITLQDSIKNLKKFKRDYESLSKTFKQCENEKEQRILEVQKYSASLIENGFIVESLNKELEESKTKEIQLQARITEIEEILSFTEICLKERDNSIEKMSSEIDLLRESSGNYKQNSMEKYTELLENIQVITMENNEFESKLDNLVMTVNQALKGYESQISSLPKSSDVNIFEEINEKVSNSEKIFKTSNEKIDNLLESLSIITELESHQDDLCMLKERFTKEFKEKSETLSEMERNLKTKEHQLISYEKELKEIKETLEKTIHESNSFSTKLIQSEAQSTIVNQRLSEIKEENSSIKKENHELENENYKLQSDIEKLESECSQIKEEFPIILRKEVEKGIYTYKKNEMLGGVHISSSFKENQSPFSRRKPTDDLSNWSIDWNKEKKKSKDTIDINKVFEDRKNVSNSRVSMKRLDRLGWFDESLEKKPKVTERKKNDFDLLVNRYFKKRMNKNSP